MKLASYAEFDPKKRAMTLGRIGLIAGAHLLVLGGGYIVTKYGSQMEQGDTALAGANGIVSWSSQDPNADQPTVSDGSASVFDSRAADLSGYNGGGQLYAGVVASNESGGGRFAPRRPSESSSNAPSRSQSGDQRSANDEVLRPLNQSQNAGARQPSQSSLGGEGDFEYTVQAGDSLWSIGKRFGVSVKDIVATNPGMKASIQVGQTVRVPKAAASGAAPAPAEPAVKTAPVNGSLYTVKSGDSLSRIASKQGVTVQELRAANNITGDMIRIGQELVIPGVSKKPDLVARQHAGQKVVVEPGDTLDKIATIHGVTVRELQELNRIQNPRSIRAGQTLLLPERAGAAPSNAKPGLTQRSAQQTPVPTPSAPPAQTAQPTLDTLDSLTEDESAADDEPLPTLDQAFQADDLEEQPLIEIQE